jgi:AcrR family transcriptional regulator
MTDRPVILVGMAALGGRMTAAPGKHGRSTYDARARRRDGILTGAARVFARKGYQSADMQSVADEVGLAKGTLYLYFSSKEELFLAAVEQGMARVMGAIRARTVGIIDPLDRIAASVAAYLRFFQENPEQVELWVQERAAFRGRGAPAYCRHREACEEEWHGLLRELIAAGRLRQVPVTRIDDVLNDLLFGALFTNYFVMRKRTPEKQAADILDVIFHGVLSDEERGRYRRWEGQ